MDRTISLISLGCAKNLVNSEEMLALLQDAGYAFTDDLAKADAVIINTCAFIESAKTEAIEKILETASYREENPNLKIVVSGCLARQNARPAPDKQTKAAVRHVKKRICAVCAVLCFGLLYLMKYWNFTASALPSALGDKLPRWDFVVPMGLSYFIFQAVGYVIDV